MKMTRLTLTLAAAAAVSATAQMPRRLATEPPPRSARFREAVRERSGNIEDRGENLEQRAAEQVDRRQERQEKRIQHGIRKGYLTPEETASLRSRQQAIASLEETFKTDGRLTRAELALLREELDKCSRMIWAEKHDAEGRQMPVYRLGKNVFAKESLTAALSNPDLTREQARALLADFRKILRLRDQLANEDLSEAQRAELQSSYETLLNAYFRVE